MTRSMSLLLTHTCPGCPGFQTDLAQTQVITAVTPTSDDGAFGRGQVDGPDADGQGFLQGLQDIGARAVGRRVVQQLFERLQLNEDDHVLQEEALDVGRQVWGIQELDGWGNSYKIKEMAKK